MLAGLGDDNINAGDGNNPIEPGTGNDTVSLGNGSDRIVLEAGVGSVTVSGFNAIADKLRLGGRLVGKSISFVTELGSTLVKAEDDLLATIKDVATGVQKAGLSADLPLYRYQAVDLGAIAPTGNATQANAINDRGLEQSDTHKSDLWRLEVELTNATGINNFGDISACGSYTYRDAKGVTKTGTRAYLLKAIPTT